MRSLFVMLLIVNAGNAMALDDPTRPPGYPLPATSGKYVPAWNVSSIRIAAEQKSAVINGRTVAIGNTVNGAKVLAIDPVKVTLKKNNKEFSVRLFSHDVMKKTRSNN